MVAYVLVHIRLYLLCVYNRLLSWLVSPITIGFNKCLPLPSTASIKLSQH